VTGSGTDVVKEMPTVDTYIAYFRHEGKSGSVRLEGIDESAEYPPRLHQHWNSRDDETLTYAFLAGFGRTPPTKLLIEATGDWVVTFMPITKAEQINPGAEVNISIVSVWDAEQTTKIKSIGKNEFSKITPDDPYDPGHISVDFYHFSDEHPVHPVTHAPTPFTGEALIPPGPGFLVVETIAASWSFEILEEVDQDLSDLSMLTPATLTELVPSLETTLNQGVRRNRWCRPNLGLGTGLRFDASQAVAPNLHSLPRYHMKGHHRGPVSHQLAALLPTHGAARLDWTYGFT
jgi:hypothetical protein